MVESDTVREIRLLSQEVYKGGKQSPFAFGHLIGQLLRLTIADSRGYIVVSQKRDDNNVFVINGWKAIGAPILLNNGSYLLRAFTPYLDQEKKKQEGDQFLRVRKEYITHQLDEHGQAWTFRPSST